MAFMQQRPYQDNSQIRTLNVQRGIKLLTLAVLLASSVAQLRRYLCQASDQNSKFGEWSSNLVSYRCRSSLGSRSNDIVCSGFSELASENAICIQKASKSGFLQLTRTSELCWFCCTYCASVLATSAAAMTNSVDAIIAQVQKEDIDQNGQYIGRAVLEDSCSEVICATPTTARSDSSGETVAAGGEVASPYLTFKRHFSPASQYISVIELEMVLGGASHRDRVWVGQATLEWAAPQWEERYDRCERSGRDWWGEAAGRLGHAAALNCEGGRTKGQACMAGGMWDVIERAALQLNTNERCAFIAS
ncbi:hypothetical protein Tcan_11958 [Toxocara canis]|uniref:Uncharacterized protein n=1 Tax=Toxocara canis TaxID=6265 RepID=A0A0B2UW01_TOXCA|nr:hypothetical protein Tcan_11958 [Toxocara canis]